MSATHIYSAQAVICDRYIINQYLAEGGMQEVYIATDPILKRQVALKTPKNDSAEKRFGTSASMSARISHPYVAKTYDYVECSGRAHLIEELISGGNLDEFLNEVMPFPDPHLVAMCLQQLSKALQASHQQGVVHRDLKPNNIIVQQSEDRLSFKITDFGIAKLAEEELSRAAQNNQTIMNSATMFGALPYMSPEVIKNPRHAGTPSDVWALAAIIYRMMTGLPPFGEGLPAIAGIMSEKLPSEPTTIATLHQFKPLTQQIWAIIRPCFLADPAARPSADALVSSADQLCYSNFPRFLGRVEKYPATASGDYGFISGAKPAFFHRDSYYAAAVKEGAWVYYAVHPGSPKDRAHPVVPVLRELRRSPVPVPSL